MLPRRLLQLGAGGVGLCFLTLSAFAADPLPRMMKDIRKMDIEGPTKALIAAGTATAGPNAAPAPAPVAAVDRRKAVIEVPTKTVIAAGSSAPAMSASISTNPKVEPGKVRWYTDFAAAEAASARSGKPVLLFQMMGKLDEQFC